MDKPILELAPHELPPEGRRDLDGEPFFFEVTIWDISRTFVGRSINYLGAHNILFYELVDEPQRGHFICPAEDKDAAGPGWQLFGKDGLDTLIERIGMQRWGRYFVLNEAFELASGNDAAYTLFLCSTGYGTLQKPLNYSLASFRWSAPCARKIWETPTSELLKRFIDSQDDSDEVNFAFSWVELSRIEHFDLVYPLRRGTYSEWIKACEWCALSFEFWGTEPKDYKLRFHVEVNGKIIVGWDTGRAALVELTENSRFHRFARWSHSYFSPTRNIELCSRYSCVADWDRGLARNSIVRGSLSRPTQHERLEALLQLREWLADKATPEEIEVLLRVQ